MNFNYAEYSNIGGRDENQDSSIVLQKENVLMVVADGLGGYQGGQIASEQVIETMFAHFMDDQTPFLCAKAILMANRDIISKQQGNIRNMKSTVAAVYISEKGIECIHVGDTRIYLFGKDSIIYQSIDHSVSYMAVLTGEITVEQIRYHEDRNRLTKSLGSEQNVKMTRQLFNDNNIEAGLICSDGFWEYVLEEEMINCYKKSSSPQEWLNKMREIHATRVNGEHDNNTAITFTLY